MPIRQESAAGLSRRRVELSLYVPVKPAVVPDQPEKSLVNQRGRLESAAGLLVLELTCGQQVELVVHQGPKLRGCSLLPRTQGRQGP